MAASRLPPRHSPTINAARAALLLFLPYLHRSSTVAFSLPRPVPSSLHVPSCCPTTSGTHARTHIIPSVPATGSRRHHGRMPPLGPCPDAIRLARSDATRSLVVLSSNSAGASAAAVAAAEDDESSATAASSDNNKPMRNLLLRAALFLGVFVLGYRAGGGGSGTTIRAAARDARRRFPVASILLAAFLARDAWRSVPSWAKPRILSSLLGSRSKNSAAEGEAGESEAASDDLTDFGSIAAKMRGLLAIGEKKLASPTKINVQASLLALLQLIGQLKQRRAHVRDERYAECGTPGTPKDMGGLDEAMEYADWAYDEHPDGTPLKELLRDKGFALLKHDKTVVPGYLGHYVAIDRERKMALIGVKGTSSLEDMLTDACGTAVTHELEDGPFVVAEGGGGGKAGNDEDDDASATAATIRCHEGILISSKRLADDIQPFVELLLPQGYDILVTGHSLGAGASCLLAVILRSRIPSLLNDKGKRLRVLAFASPPILDYENALACSPFTTTIVNNSDIITRASLANLVLTMKVLKVIHERLDREGMGSSDPATTWAFVKKLSEGTKGDMLMSAEELAGVFEEVQDSVDLDDPDHLYVPGRVVLMYDLWEKLYQKEEEGEETDADANTADEEGEVGRGTESEGEGVNEKTEGEDTADEGEGGEHESERTAEGVALTDGTAKVLRYIEYDRRMLDDHMAPAYKSSIKALLTPVAEAEQP